MGEDSTHISSETESRTISNDDSAQVDKVLSVLKVKNDTSRFVGLALLRSLLDSNEELRNDPDTISRCWQAIPESFLKRLLLSRQIDKRNEGEAQSMIQLAIAIIRNFAALLPASETSSAKWTTLCSPLMESLPYVEEDSQKQAVQGLLHIVETNEGASAFLHSDPAEPLLNILLQHDSGLQLLRQFAQAIRAQDINTEKEISLLVRVVKVIGPSEEFDRSGERLDCISAVVSLMPERVSNSDPDWALPAIALIQRTMTKHPTRQARKACTMLSALLIREASLDGNLLELLFKPTKQDGVDTSHFSYIFINLVLIEIRSSMPSLLESIEAQSYAATSALLSSGYTVVGAFIEFLVQQLRDDMDIDASWSLPAPDQLLKLRKDISETMSLTMEYFRDRYDATQTTPQDIDLGPPEKKLLKSSVPVPAFKDDAVIVSGLRTLAQWLRDDDNDKLRDEATVILDILLYLYVESSDSSRYNLKPTVLMALEPLTESEESVKAIQDNNGWDILSTDLKAILETNDVSLSERPTIAKPIVRVLLAVVESPLNPQSKASQLLFVSFFAGLKAGYVVTRPSRTDMYAIDDWVSTCQLVIALLVKAPTRLIKEHREHVERIKRVVESALKAIGKAATGEADGLEIREGLEDCLDGIRSVGV
ncbi:DUF1941-domain-containing protein [Aulographum hederae CBS 113979]|uniref:DUF1941-domain-containing protein n=1 Tax=Aulographum hederae CBS 113979 TaxID=1176131 RepID=A0A6G1GJY2_9PEZI|nr:DUF1941-domain-containing protein [Aulographum hederae CBS 113979]